MVRFENPAVKEFARRIVRETALAQVLIQRRGEGFELRHMADANKSGLGPVSIDAIRRLAQFTSAGTFRPLKSAPDLRTGWVLNVADAHELGFVLDQLYPGALADWYAVESGNPRVTHYREFAERQSGMYRITAMLDDAGAAAMIAVCCGRDFCLKRRFWTVAGLPVDSAREKSPIPCLEPCALLLEFARKTMRLQQAEQIADLESMPEFSPEPEAADFMSSGIAAHRGAGAGLEKLRDLRKALFSSVTEE